MPDNLVVVRGGGDLGTGVALRLWRCGLKVIILETPRPVAVRRSVSFAEAVYEGQMAVEEVSGVLVTIADLLEGGVRERLLVAVDPEARSLPELAPCAVVDAIMAKRNVGTRLEMASTVIALGPGFRAGRDVHAVVETNRGPHLGRVIWCGCAQLNTGSPGEVGGQAANRVLRAPNNGVLRTQRSIGDIVDAGDLIAEVDGTVIVAPFRSLLRGLIRDGMEVTSYMKIGDIDPRLDPSLCTLVSDKALAVAGGVLEAILSRRQLAG